MHLQIVGHGTRVYSDGSRYEGLFVEGEASGQGVYSSSKGWKIEANFVANRPVGHGQWENIDGDRYEGEVLDFSEHGRLIYGVHGHNGGALTHYFMQAGGFNGSFDGHGVLRRCNGYVYNGEWSAGMKHGHGVEESAGEIYTVCPCQPQ